MGWDGQRVDAETLLDLEREELSECHQKLLDIFGDTLHGNGGEHLSGGVANDQHWQNLHHRVISHPHRLYNPPKGRVGKRFIRLLVKEMKGVRDRTHNSERFLVLPACILARTPGTFKAKEIARRVEVRLDLWEAGQHECLVANICRDAARRAGGSRRGGEAERDYRNYNSTVLDGKLRQAVRNITSRDGGGVLSPDDICTKAGKPVLEVLKSKHPELRTPDLADPNCVAFEGYDEGLAVPIPLDATQEDVEDMSTKLQGSAGPSSLCAVGLRNYLTLYEKASAELREEVAEWTGGLANSAPPWAAYRGLLMRRAVPLAKKPKGTRPVGVGESWQRAISKVALKDCGADEKEVCGSIQLCAGLEAGIKGLLHAMMQQAEKDEAMLFDKWEVDNEIWREGAEEGETPP